MEFCDVDWVEDANNRNSSCIREVIFSFVMYHVHTKGIFMGIISPFIWILDNILSRLKQNSTNIQHLIGNYKKT